VIEVVPDREIQALCKHNIVHIAPKKLGPQISFSILSAHLSFNLWLP
jgi:hypothetical protein